MQDPLMNKVLNILSDTPLSKGGFIKDDNLTAEQINQTEELINKYKINDLLKYSLKNSFGLGGCLIYMDFGLEDLEEPLDLTRQDTRKFKGFKVIEPINITAINTNTSEPAKQNYMEPESWYVVGLGVCHKSHFLKFTQNEPPYMLKPLCLYFGYPLTALIKSDIANTTLVSQGIAELIGRMRYIYLKTSRENFTSAGVENFKQRMYAMSKFKGNFNVDALGLEEEVIQLNTSVAGLKENEEFFYQLVSAKTSIPMTELMGVSASGMNATGEGDRKSWYDKVKNIQQSIKSNLLIILGILAGLKDGEYKQIQDYIFNPLEELNKKEQIEIFRGEIDIAKSLIDLGIKNDNAIEYLKRDKDFNIQDFEIDTDTPDLIDYEEEPQEDTTNLNNGGVGSGVKGHKTDKIKEKQSKVNIDFSKDNYLPELNEEDLKELGKESKPVLLKKSIIERNKERHPDIKENEYNKLISKALYEPDYIFPGNNPKYTNFVSKLNDKNNSTVLLEMGEENKNYEIVHIHKIKDRNLQKMKERDDK